MFLLKDCVLFLKVITQFVLLCSFRKATTILAFVFGRNHVDGDEMTLEKHLLNCSAIHATMYQKNILDQKATNEKLQQKIKHQDQIIHDLREQFKTLTEKIEGINMAKNTHEEKSKKKVNIKDLSQIRKTQEDMQRQVRGLEDKVTDMDMRHQLIENITFEGRMIWKIDQFQLRCSNAESGKITALHSAPSFTERYGYKYCCRIYLNGDGAGLKSHVSIFFVLMKSEYDCLLEWPFKKKITFTLLNQLNSSLNVKDSFVADSKAPSFQRPTKSMNMAAGSPRFIEKERLKTQGYIVQDSIFIEVDVT